MMQLGHLRSHTAKNDLYEYLVDERVCELCKLKNYWQVIISSYESQTGIIYPVIGVGCNPYARRVKYTDA